MKPIIGILALLVPAAGPHLPARGVHATSMGGAYVAGADGINAFWYNPARLDATMVGVEVGIVSLSGSYTAADGDQAGVRADNNGRPIPNPTFGFAFKLNDMVTIGAAAFAPYAGFTRFDENGPQRYALIESDRSRMLFIAAGAAFHFNRLRVGATLQNVMGDIKQRVMISGYSGIFGYAEDPDLDILEEVELKDDKNLTGNFGATFDISPITLGLAVQLPYSLSGEADYRVRLPSSVFFDSAEVEGNKVQLTVPFPLAIRAGVLWTANDRFKMEAAVNYEHWSILDKLTIDPHGQIKLHGVPSIGDYEIPALTVDRRMKDTVSVHLGADVEVVEGLHLRGGGYYEPSAFGDETFSVAQLDQNKIGVALGASWQAGPFRFDVAASRVFQGTRVVEKSELRQFNPTNPEQAEIIGNGTYQSNLWVIGAGVEYRYGAR